MPYDPNYYKPAYKPYPTKQVKFSDSVDLEPQADRGVSVGAITALSSDLEDVKNVLRRLCNLFRALEKRVHTPTCNAPNNGQDPLVQVRPSLDEELGLCGNQN